MRISDVSSDVSSSELGHVGDLPRFDAVKHIGVSAKDAGCRTGRVEQDRVGRRLGLPMRSEEHTSELQSLMRISYAVFCLKKKKKNKKTHYTLTRHNTIPE